jgi:hypothetical protein
MPSSRFSRVLFGRRCPPYRAGEGSLVGWRLGAEVFDTLLEANLLSTRSGIQAILQVIGHRPCRVTVRGRNACRGGNSGEPDSRPTLGRRFS